MSGSNVDISEWLAAGHEITRGPTAHVIPSQQADAVPAKDRAELERYFDARERGHAERVRARILRRPVMGFNR